MESVCQRLFLTTNISFLSKGRNNSQLHFIPQNMRDIILPHHTPSLIQALF